MLSLEIKWSTWATLHIIRFYQTYEKIRKSSYVNARGTPPAYLSWSFARGIPLSCLVGGYSYPLSWPRCCPGPDGYFPQKGLGTRDWGTPQKGPGTWDQWLGYTRQKGPETVYPPPPCGLTNWEHFYRFRKFPACWPTVQRLLLFPFGVFRLKKKRLQLINQTIRNRKFFLNFNAFRFTSVIASHFII